MISRREQREKKTTSRSSKTKQKQQQKIITQLLVNTLVQTNKCVYTNFQSVFGIVFVGHVANAKDKVSNPSQCGSNLKENPNTRTSKYNYTSFRCSFNENHTFYTRWLVVWFDGVPMIVCVSARKFECVCRSNGEVA